MSIAMLGCSSHVANTAAASYLSFAVEFLKKICKLGKIIVRNFITSRENKHVNRAPTYHTCHHEDISCQTFPFLRGCPACASHMTAAPHQDEFGIAS